MAYRSCFVMFIVLTVKKIEGVGKELNSTLDEKYDSSGAIMYIAAVVIWYSLGVIGILITKFRNDRELKKRKVRRQAWYSHNWGLPNLESLNQSKPKEIRSNQDQMEILEVLSNEGLRSKLWDIYFGDSERPQTYYDNENFTRNLLSKRLDAFGNDWNTNLGTILQDFPRKSSKSNNSSAWQEKILPRIKRGIVDSKTFRATKMVMRGTRPGDKADSGVHTEFSSCHELYPHNMDTVCLIDNCSICSQSSESKESQSKHKPAFLHRENSV